MISVFGKNNLKNSNGLKELLKLNLFEKRSYSSHCLTGHISEQQQIKHGSRGNGYILRNPHIHNKLNRLRICNCYYGTARYKSVGQNREGYDNLSTSDLKPIGLSKDEILKIFNDFYLKPQIRNMADNCGLKGNFFHNAFIQFRRHCVEQEQQPADLVDILKGIKGGKENISDIFSHFLTFSKTQFPHLNFIDELKSYSDLTEPAKWYPEARTKQRKVIYHAGPTNSGKTYHALQRFLAAKSGVYCGPLRLLAAENFKKANANGTPCDLITGEERKYVNESGEPSGHQACTVEMTNLAQPYEVAVIDEIQMIRDSVRGWAWTRAFLGVCADEIHVCGEESGIGLIKELCEATGDKFKVQRYNRLTSLTILDTALESFDDVRPGDCIVCFNKNDIFNVCKELEKRKIEMAVIYGTLPAATKLANAEKFNDPNNSCKVMVATDAVGMGLNLSIKRVIFYSISKPSKNNNDKLELIQPSAALQIAGRAGRFNTQFEGGEVTTFKSQDLQTLKELLNTPIQPIEKAGLAPTLEQIELYNLCLPEVSLTDTMDIFMKMCTMDESKYFMSDMDNFKFLSNLLEGIPLSLKQMYTFCCAPISERQGVSCSMLVKFARQFSNGIPMTLDWVCNALGWPFDPPATIKDLINLEEVYDVFDLYHWLSYRYPDLFPHTDPLSKIQNKLEELITMGVQDIIKRLEEASVQSEQASSRLTNPHEVIPDLPILSKRHRMIASKILLEVKIAMRPTTKISHYFMEAQEKLVEQEKKRLENLEKVKLSDGKDIYKMLLKEGILTPKIMEMLRAEMLADGNDGNSSKQKKSRKKPVKPKS